MQITTGTSELRDITKMERIGMAENATLPSIPLKT
jgi:hypothetical protein